jgi:hypothetical protein
MSGRAFILLKVGCSGPKSTKQVEIRPVDLPTILRITGRNRGNLPQKEGKVARQDDARKDFPDMANSPQSPVLLSKSQFQRENWRSIAPRNAAKAHTSITLAQYT